MQSDTTRSNSAADRFWDRYIASLSNKGVSEAEARWCVIRAEHYIKAFPDKRLVDHTVEDVTGYLESIGRLGRLEDWQFAQVIDAIQNLLLSAGVASAAEVDWGFWRDSARSLPSNHPTIAREDTLPQEEPVSGARFKEKRNKASFPDSVRRDHSKLLERLSAEIRRRMYSIS